MGAEGSDSRTSQQQTQNTDTFIDPTQAGFLGNLWSQAQGFANAGGAQQVGQDLGGQFTPGLTQGFNNLLGMTNVQPEIDANVAGLQAGLGNLFSNEINPAIEGNAIMSGQFGGGRSGVAQGVAAGEIANAFAQGYGDIVSRANQRGLQAAGYLPQFAQGALGFGTAAQSGGLDALSRLAAIYGGPTVLQRSRGQSTSESRTQSFGFDIPLPG